MAAQNGGREVTSFENPRLLAKDDEPRSDDLSPLPPRAHEVEARRAHARRPVEEMVAAARERWFSGRPSPSRDIEKLDGDPAGP
jgi:hypothetical protein